MDFWNLYAQRNIQTHTCAHTQNKDYFQKSDGHLEFLLMGLFSQRECSATEHY